MVTRKVLITKNRCSGNWNVSCTCCDKDCSYKTFLTALWYADHHIVTRHRTNYRLNRYGNIRGSQ